MSSRTPTPNWKVAKIAYIRLDDSFQEPLWRQAAVVAIADDELTLAVRISSEEAAEGSATTVKVGNRRFVLVRGAPDQLRERCQEPHVSLEVKPQELCKAALQLVEAEADVVYVTASEDTEVAPPQKAKKSAVTADSESDSEESSEDGGVDLSKLLAKARKTWLDTGSSSDADGNAPRGRNKSIKQRFPFLEKTTTKAPSSSSLDPTAALQMQLLKGKNQDPLQTLVALELLKATRAKPKHRRDPSTSSSSSSQSRNGTNDRRNKAPQGLGKAFANYRQSKKRMFRNPKKHIKKYVREVQEQLGAGPDTPFRLTDYSKKIWWGRQRTLQRLHVLLSEVLTLQLENKHEEATLQVVLGLRAIHQAALDGGSWEIAWLLTHVEDPIQRRRFGGEESQLETVAAYLRSQQELEKRARQARLGGRTDLNSEDNPNPDQAADKEKERRFRKGAGKGQDN